MKFKKLTRWLQSAQCITMAIICRQPFAKGMSLPPKASSENMKEAVSWDRSKSLQYSYTSRCDYGFAYAAALDASWHF